jgi:eukaryotic-like serine/threonine-protein kinase
MCRLATAACDTKTFSGSAALLGALYFRFSPRRTALLTESLARLTDALADRYTIERELGRGGMATVYLAHDRKHHRRVALKVLHPELAYALGADRFLREIEVAANLTHPHILPLFDSGEVASLLYYVMPYVEGESLRDRLTREIQLPVDEAVGIAHNVAAALAYAHGQGVVHRDIKPENILFEGDEAVVTDFGIAKAVSAAGGDRLTETGMVVGTAAYMSPEQASGERQIDGRSDVYSLGCVLYEILVGEPPYTGPTAQAIIAKRFSDPVPSVRRLRPAVPEALEGAVTRALAPVAADRFASAAEFARALQATTAAPTATLTGRSTAADGRARRQLPVAATALGVGFLIGLGALFAWRRSHAGAGETGGAKVVAVLPFENLGDSSQAYFADGVSDEVRGKLSQLAGLAVIARASSNEYRHTNKPPQQIARELGAEYLLNATVRWEKHPDGTSRVRVSPELVRVDPGAAPTTKWQQGFDAALTDVFAVQTDIATQVASALHVHLADQTRELLARKPTENFAAYDVYLQAVSEAGDEGFDPVNQPLVLRAIAALTRAITLDSGFALAWARLAQAHMVRFTMSGTREDSAAAMDAVGRALALDSSTAAIRLTASDVVGAVSHDSVRARGEFAEAVRLAPNDAAILSRLAFRKQGAERIQRLRRAQMLNPRAPEIATRLYVALSMDGRYEEAVTAADQWAALEFHSPNALNAPVLARLLAGDSADAARLAQARVSGSDLHEGLLGLLNGGLLWLLPREAQRRALDFRPAVYGGNRMWWASGMADAARTLGDSARMRAYADSGLQVAPTAAVDELFLRAQMYAMVGRRAAAERMIVRYRQITTEEIGFRDALVGVTYRYLPDPPDSAVKYLSRSIDEGWGRIWAGMVRFAPEYAFVRRDPHFRPYLDQVVSGRYHTVAP